MTSTVLLEAIAITEAVGKIFADEMLEGVVVDSFGILVAVVITAFVLDDRVLYSFPSLRKTRNRCYQYQDIFKYFAQR